MLYMQQPLSKKAFYAFSFSIILVIFKMIRFFSYTILLWDVGGSEIFSDPLLSMIFNSIFEVFSSTSSDWVYKHSIVQDKLKYLNTWSALNFLAINTSKAFCWIINKGNEILIASIRVGSIGPHISGCANWNKTVALHDPFF